MEEGRVKWFSDQKGYGFIEREDDVDVFVHASEIQMEGFRCLNEGDLVEFEIRKSERGLSAENVVVV